MVDFHEIKKKNGNRLIFCNLEELVLDITGYKSADFLDTSKYHQGDEYICHCPFCKKEGHRKSKLYIKDDFTVGHCFVCTRSYINVTDELDLSFRVPDFLMKNQDLDLVRLDGPEWNIDKYWTDFDDYDEHGVKYLEGRHIFMRDLYKPLGFKFLDGNVVMPFKYHDEIFYYQVRFTRQSKIKYFFPPIAPGAKPPYIIESGDRKKFIICEGIYDAISLLIQAPGYTPMAVLGSSVTEYQLKFLREYVPEKIIVYMDKTEISARIANKIKSVIDYCPISVIRSDGVDPEEMMNHRLRHGQKLQWIK